MKAKEPTEYPVTNDTRQVIHLGGIMIPPKETRVVPARHVPAHLRPVQAKAKPETPKDVVLELVESKADVVTKALPDLSDEQLARLEAAENEGKARKGVLKAISELQTERADKRTRREEYNQMAIEALLSHRQNLSDDESERALVDDVLVDRSTELQAHREALADNPEGQAQVDELLVELGINEPVEQS